jgi:hypothetical protein
MNIPLLRKVQRHILTEPQRVYMGDWIMTNEQAVRRGLRNCQPACGTVACIAGWAAILSDCRDEWHRTERPHILDIPYHSERRLFYTLYWDGDWAAKLRATVPGTRAYAQVVSDYIDYFIETYAEPAELVRS